jgi:superfamily II DNA/RNA helicase
LTSFAETVQWLVDGLRALLAKERALSDYRGHLVSVTGTDAQRGVSRSEAVFELAPESSEAPHGREKERLDVAVTTDLLTDGANLQQCRNVIKCDLPRNPMWLEQWHGRIDRIGSPRRGDAGRA